MQNTVIAIVSASLMIVSMVQMASAAEHHINKPKHARAVATQQFRNANDLLPPASVVQQDWAEFGDGHAISAPAGRN
jgi:hypothetical protein